MDQASVHCKHKARLRDRGCLEALSDSLFRIFLNFLGSFVDLCAPCWVLDIAAVFIVLVINKTLESDIRV